MQLTEKETLTIERYGKFLREQNPSTDFLVQILELTGGHLNLETIQNYCKRTGMSYNGAKNYRKIFNMFGVRYVIENN